MLLKTGVLWVESPFAFTVPGLFFHAKNCSKMKSNSRRRALKVLAATTIAIPAMAAMPTAFIPADNDFSPVEPDEKLKKRIQEASNALFDETVRNREHLHQNPELSHFEVETVQFIVRKLRDFGIQELEIGELGVGVLAIIRGEKMADGPVMAIRADIDALPITEVKTAPCRSKKEAVMHACGHDFHTSSLLSAAKILHDFRSEWSGIIKILFQRGEERPHPTLNRSGALLALENGLMKAPRPTVIFGQHASPEIQFGQVGFFPTGQIGSMAAVDVVKIDVFGADGGHGAAPWQGLDPVPTAASIITNLQVLLSRRTNPNSPCVLTFGEIKTEGGSMNVLAQKVSMVGTLRTFDLVFREKMVQEMKDMVQLFGTAFHTESKPDFAFLTIPLTNSPALNDRTRKQAIAYLGKENVVESARRTGGEDFSYYQTAENVETCFWRIGTGDPANGKFSAGLHKNNFDIYPEAMRQSPGLLAWLAISELKDRMRQ